MLYNVNLHGIDKQTATLPDERVENGKNLSEKKELIRALSLICPHPETGNLREVICARFWMARSADGASPVYCSVWVRGLGNQEYFAGHGRARGCGYHKASAAMQFAFDNAGIRLSEPIDGRGDSEMERAMLAITKTLGFDHEKAYILTHA